jgi:spoIIIJ-associated protein
MSEYTGRTVEEALAAALADLGLPRESVSVTVLGEGRRGVMGLGAEDARIEVEPLQAGGTPPPLQPGATRPADTPAPAAPGSPEAAELGKRLLGGALARMGVVAEVSVRGTADPIVLDVSGEPGQEGQGRSGLGLVIGWRGETLNALQTWVSIAVNRDNPGEDRLRVVIDVEGYRQRREDTLKDMALRIADRVAATGQPIALEAMHPYERRIVHVALAEHPDVETYSSGEEPHRHVVVEPLQTGTS